MELKPKACSANKRSNNKTARNSVKLPKQIFHDGVTYELIKVLGRGGYAVALSARRIVAGGEEKEDEDTLVAIKTINKGAFETKKANQVVHFAKREVNIMKALEHPNIVKLYSHWADENFIFMVMELCVNKVSVQSF